MVICASFLIGTCRGLHPLSAMLLSFLHLQHDPGIPGLAFGEWREGLERAFREEGFWEGVGEE